MLLLHGYLSCKESFYYQIKFLSQYFKVTAPDIYGFGKSAPLESPFSVGDYAEWLKDFVREACIENPHIIAHSFGARVALKYLGEGLGVADRLILTGGAGLVKPRSPEYMRKVRAYRRIRKIFPGFAERHFGSAEYRALPPVMKESYKKIVNEDLSAYAEKIENRTYLIYGRGDATTPADEEGKTFNRLILGSRLEIMEGGHFCFSENPDIFNKKIYEFFTEK